MRRGRPPYPDLLTPREQEVLALIREGLTNDQIATRLGISESGARYHVSEILSKLGVSNRHEAAQWDGRTGWLSKLGLSVPHIGLNKVMAAFVATGLASMAALAIGILIMSGRDNPQPSNAAPPTVAADAVNQYGLHEQLLSYADNLYRVTRAALHDPAACQCPPPPDLVISPQNAQAACKSVGREILASPDYDPSRDEPLTTTLIESCEQLLDNTDTKFFAGVAQDIVARLEPILISEHAKVPVGAPSFVPTPASRSQAAPPNLYSPSERTGVPAIDRTLDLLAAGRWQTLADEAAYQDQPCTFLPQLGALECGLAEPEGTIHSVVTLGGCEPGPSELPFVDDALSQLSTAFLYAVFQTDGAWAPETRYLLLFRMPGQPNVDLQLLLDQSGRVTGFGSCGVADWLPADGDTTILPRKS